jgi:hypothetical protein
VWATGARLIFPFFLDLCSQNTSWLLTSDLIPSWSDINPLKSIVTCNLSSHSCSLLNLAWKLEGMFVLRIETTSSTFGDRSCRNDLFSFAINKHWLCLPQGTVLKILSCDQARHTRKTWLFLSSAFLNTHRISASLEGGSAPVANTEASVAWIHQLSKSSGSHSLGHWKCSGGSS